MSRLTGPVWETKYGTSQDVGKSGICSKSGCREETKYGASHDAGKSGICSKSDCREEI